MVVANVAMVFAYGGIFLLDKAANDGGNLSRTVGAPSLFLMPFLSGIVAAFVWRLIKPTVGEAAMGALGILIIGILGAVVVIHEGVICLLMVSPLFYGLILAGALLGRLWFKANNSHLRLSVLPLLVVAILGEPYTRTDQTGVAVDELLIHAPPSRVWPEVTAFPTIPAPPRFWLFRLGLPYPEATTSAGNFVGADRRCIFSGGAVFKESVAEFVPGENLTFDILESPPDPELIGHLTPQRGQFLLRDNHDGTTTLIGSTWYSLHVRPLWYFDWWTRHIFRAVHLRVMQDVRRRAEAPSPASLN
jgi:hypothetical protein